MSVFSRYIGIDYSGSETPEVSLQGLRVSILGSLKRTIGNMAGLSNTEVIRDESGSTRLVSVEGIPD